jgi:hypothetical protein
VIETAHRTDPLTRVVALLSSTYRALPQSKLLGTLPDGRSRVEAGHRLALQFALWGQGVEERALSAAPRWRELPFDGPFIVGDQIAVTGHDLVAGMRELPDLDEPVWRVGGGRVAAGEVLEAALAEANRLKGAV